MTKNGKKLGRPRKTDAEKALSKTTAKAEKAPKKSKKEEKEWQTTFQKIEVLAQMGALHIKLGGVEVAFAPDAFQNVATRNGSLGPVRDFDADSDSDEEIRDQVAQLAKVAPMDNPDQYAEQQDRWANHEPLPRI